MKMRNKFLSRWRSRNEVGASLMGVVLISSFVFTTLISVAGTVGIGSVTTANSRGTIKAYAAAEAGRDTVFADLFLKPCVASGSVAESNITPAYEWRVYRYRSQNSEVPTSKNDRGVAYGCPTFASTHVLIEATGIDKSGARKTILSTYRWHPNGSSPLQAAVGSGRDLPLSNTDIILPPNSVTPGDVIVTTGTFRCLGSSTRVQGSVYVLQGDAELGGCSTINGNVSAAGQIRFTGNSSRIVDGNVCTKDYIRGYRNGQVGGTVHSYQANCPGLEYAGWADYNPTPERTHTLTASSCGQLATIARDALTPVVIDAQACGTGVTVPSMTLKTDVTIMARGFNVSNVTFRSADGLGYMMNLVTPDFNKNEPARPDCGANQSSSKFLQLNMEPPMMGLIYSPCVITHVTGTWSGQIYSGEVQSNFAAGTIYYIPTPAPGLDSDRISGYASPVLLSHVEY